MNFICWTEKMSWLFLSFLLMTSFRNSSSVTSQCEYNGDICSLDPDECFKLALLSYKIPECAAHNLRYGPGEIFDTRGDIQFWVEIVHEREIYAKDLTYRFFSYIKTPENLRPIDGCCSLTLNETCTLPPSPNDEEKQFAIIPMRDGSFCRYPIHESPGFIKWCKGKDPEDVLCKEYVNGILIIRSIFVALSTESYNPAADYCFFEVPTEHYDSNHSEDYDNGLTMSVTNVSMVTGEGRKVKIGQTVINCDNNSVDNEKGLNIFHVFKRYKRSADVIPCVMSRSRNDERWDTSPICAIPDEGTPSRSWVAIIIVVILGFVVILVAILLGWIYKKHVKICFPKFDDTIHELPDRHKAVLEENVDEEQNFIMDERNGNVISKNANEKAEEIIRKSEQKIGDVKQPIKNPENPEISYLLKSEVGGKLQIQKEEIITTKDSEKEDVDSTKRKDSGCEIEGYNSSKTDSTENRKPDHIEIIYENELSSPELTKLGPDSGFSQTSIMIAANSLPGTNCNVTAADPNSPCPNSPVFDCKTDIPGVNTGDGYIDKSDIADGVYTPKFVDNIDISDKHSFITSKDRNSFSSSGCGSFDEETFHKIDIDHPKDHTKLPIYIKQSCPDDENAISSEGPFILTVSDGYTSKDMI